ncbi:MAG: type III secretion inner membrane ring lipoprotein SctJ [Rubrivivax sp.]|nr:type III secretion inner membrane ring lipoprotein SctJ [Rubrivivax sp.]
MKPPRRPEPLRPLRALHGLALALALTLLSACSQQLLGDLDEPAANQVVAALRGEGIAADKVHVTGAQWKVTVPEDEFSRSTQVLRRRNLPPQQFEGLGRVFKKESLVSTPTEERARLIYAMSQEMERSLSGIDGVLSARVHPVIPPHDPLNPKKVASSASVLIKFRPGAEIATREAMVRALVASGIEGLSYDDVRVLMFESEKQSPLLDKPAISRAVPPIFWGILGLLLGVLLVTYFVLNWRDKTTVGLDNLRGRLLRKQRGDKRTGAPRSSNEPGVAPRP